MPGVPPPGAPMMMMGGPMGPGGMHPMGMVRPPMMGGGPRYMAPMMGPGVPMMPMHMNVRPYGGPIPMPVPSRPPMMQGYGVM